MSCADGKVSKVNDATASVTQREKTRERVRRHRAASKQATLIEFVRKDAILFLHPDRLSQKAGAPKAHLRRMAVKELVDNALDAADKVVLMPLDNDTFVIEDDGPGIAPKKVVTLFSVIRPMMSTKLIRHPTRGMVTGGRRVELNAMPSDVFIKWIEGCLRAHDVQKVIPPAATIERRARQIIGLQHIKSNLAELEQYARQHAEAVDMPTDLTERMLRQFELDPTLPWEDALGNAIAISGNAS
jgi:hypothetical protein